MYFGVVLDLYSRKVVGWAMRDHQRIELPLAALMMASQRQHPKPGLLHHSGRGSQYASAEYWAVLAATVMVQSMSRTGNCWDNAPIESFLGTPKAELAITRPDPTHEAACRDLFAYIEGDDHRQRIHPDLGYPPRAGPTKRRITRYPLFSGQGHAPFLPTGRNDVNSVLAGLHRFG